MAVLRLRVSRKPHRAAAAIEATGASPGSRVWRNREGRPATLGFDGMSCVRHLHRAVRRRRRIQEDRLCSPAGTSRPSPRRWRPFPAFWRAGPRAAQAPRFQGQGSAARPDRHQQPGRAGRPQHQRPRRRRADQQARDRRRHRLGPDRHELDPGLCQRQGRAVRGDGARSRPFDGMIRDQADKLLKVLTTADIRRAKARRRSG
jgi:hypothetical protein